MAKYNKKKVGHVPTKVNKMGTAAYELSPEEELVSTVLTTFVQKSYYESENEILKRITEAASKCDPEFVAKCALYTRQEANMRSSSHVLAADLANRVSGTDWGSRFYKNVSVRPDDMSEILGYYLNVKRKDEKTKKITNAMKKGFRSKLESMDPYLIDKYKMPNREISLIDLVNLFHPKPTQSNKEAYKRLVEGKPLDDLYTSKILEKEKSKAGQSAKTIEEKSEAKAKAINETLETNMDNTPIMNLLRNLKSIVENTPEKVDMACDILRNRDKILKSRLLPFRFASAYAEVESLSSRKEKSRIQFESVDVHNHVDKVLASLEDAMNISCENIPKLKGNTAILIDHSGSMRGDSGGSSRVSTFSSVRTSGIANLFGCMLMQSQDNVFMGLFGDILVTVDEIDRSKGILENNREVHAMGSKCGGSSEHGIFEFFADVVMNKVRVDNVVVFSDMVIGSERWYGKGTVNGYSVNGGSFQKLFKDFKKINPQCNVITVDICQTDGTTVFNKNHGVTQISGWSNKIFDVLGTIGRGYEDIIKEIKKIQL